MPQPGSRCRQGEIPFSSDRKRMSVIVKHEGPEMLGDARSSIWSCSGCKISQAAAAESGPHTTVWRCSSPRGEYWCLCKGADNIMGLDPQLLRGTDQGLSTTDLTTKTPEAFVWSTFGGFPWVKSHPLLQAGSTNACGTPGLPLQLQNGCTLQKHKNVVFAYLHRKCVTCCSRMLSFQQGCLTDLQRLLVGQAQTPDLTLLSTVAWSQIASKKLNDHEFVEDWLARWKEATVAEVLAIWFISACA